MRLPVPLCRLVYRVAWTVLHGWWMLVHPHVRGVKCVLADGDRILLVRHTYGRREWDVPGGKLRRREDPRAGASREMREELGVSDIEWDDLGLLPVLIDGRHDDMHIFRGEIGDRPLTLDRCEIAEARWFPQAGLPASLGRCVPDILERARGGAGDTRPRQARLGDRR